MEKADITQHISQQFNEELEEVRNMVLTMGGMVEKNTSDAIRALVTADSALGERVANEDYRVNAMEVSIDEDCGRILARRQPAASDLRVIMMVIKTITDLERIGDEAERIAKTAAEMDGSAQMATHYSDIRHLGDGVMRILRDALDAFARLDADAAIELVGRDRQIDSDYEALIRQLSTFMMEDPRHIRRAIDVMWSARALERIGDHATNICEYVVYMVHGRDVRHITEEQMRSEINAIKKR